MLATVLKSPRATATTLAIIESFAHLRELSRNLNILSTETDEGKQKTLTQRSSELLHELLSVEEDRLAGRKGCALDELEDYLESIIAGV